MGGNLFSCFSHFFLVSSTTEIRNLAGAKSGREIEKSLFNKKGPFCYHTKHINAPKCPIHAFGCNDRKTC